jgi:hypothetical protein
MPAPDDEAVRWETAAEVRRARPGWVVIWSKLRDEYQARPLFRTPKDTVASAATSEELITQIDAIQQAAKRNPSQVPRSARR